MGALLEMSTLKFLFGLFLSLMLVSSLVVGVLASPIWSQTFGGEYSDAGNCVIQTFDGGFVIAGSTDLIEDDGGGFWLISIDDNANMLWQKTYTDDSWDVAHSVVQTSDGGFVVVGSHLKDYNEGADEICLVRTDGDGNMLWQKLYGGEYDDVGFSVVQTNDGGFIIGGQLGKLTESYVVQDLLLLKTDENGNQEWLQTYGGDSYDRHGVAIQTSDGGYALAGLSRSFGSGNHDFWLIKTDSNGNQLWNRTYGGSESEDFESMIQTNDGGYALVGMIEYNDMMDRAFWVVKADANGNMEWSERYCETGFSSGESIVQTSDGGFAIAGWMFVEGDDDNTDLVLIKTDENGIEQWNKTFGEAYRDEASSLIQTSDGGYAITGDFYSTETQTDCLLIKTDAYGEIPEFPSWVILPLVLTITLFSLILKIKLSKERGLNFSPNPNPKE